MHQIAFDLKRGHLRTVAWGETALRGVGGMTAARFDLLCLLRQKNLLDPDYGHGPLRDGLPQHELSNRLDLHKSTVSKMLTRLEAMGWIRRERSTKPGDWRTKKVFFTPLGLQRIAKAMRVMFRQRTMLKYFERIFKIGKWRFTHVVKNLLEVSETIQYVADCFGDRSIICYDYGPQLAEGPWDSFGRRLPYDPLYVPCPIPRMPPPPRKGPRSPCRPFDLGDAALDRFWGNEKRRRKR